MNSTQAAERWEVAEPTVKIICEHMQVDPENIPEDLVPVYVAPSSILEDPHSEYLIILNVIMNTHLDIEGIDQHTIETCLKQLREENLIVLKNGRPPDSGDYHDYILSPDRDRFYRWHDCKTKSTMNILKLLISLLKKIFL